MNNTILYKEIENTTKVRNNPKKFEKGLSILSVGSYIKPTEVDTTKTIAFTNNKPYVETENEFKLNSFKEIKDLDEICRITRISKKYLAVFFGISATLINDEILTIKIGENNFKVLYFPKQGSNVAIYTNAQNKSSYVVDGRAMIEDDRIRVLSTNELSLKRWFREYAENQAKNLPIKTFDKILSEELWQIKEDNSDEEDEIIKSLMWLEYTNYMNMPEFNICWLVKKEDNKLVEDKWTNYDLSSFENLMRISSISQNGVTATIGSIDEQGYVIPNTVKPFFGVKGKFDISATNGIKNFKTYKKNPKKVLIVLAEVNFGNGPINALGNNLVTKEAYDEYVTLKTRELSNKFNIQYPAHKTFIKIAGEPVRVKGATSFIQAKATFENGSTEDKILILPPSEYNTKGELEQDIDKFKFVLAYRDNAKKNKLQNIQLEVEKDNKVIIINTVGFYADVYEDCHHSALSSGMEIKHQNLFYYGAFAEFYRNNDFDKVKNAIADRIDQELLTSVYSFLGMNVK